MKNSHLLKMLIIAFTLQSSQILSLSIFGPGGYLEIKQQLSTFDKEKNASLRVFLIRKFFANLSLDLENNSALQVWVNANFSAAQLEELRNEVAIWEKLEKQALEERALENQKMLKRQEMISNCKKVAAVAAALSVAYAAYKNREALKAGAIKLTQNAAKKAEDVKKWAADNKSKLANQASTLYANAKSSGSAWISTATDLAKKKADSLRTSAGSLWNEVHNRFSGGAKKAAELVSSATSLNTPTISLPEFAGPATVIPEATSVVAASAVAPVVSNATAAAPASVEATATAAKIASAFVGSATY